MVANIDREHYNQWISITIPASAGKEKESIMKRFTIFAVMALALVFALVLGGCGKGGDSKAPAATATPSLNVQDGQWEITMQTEIPGMPAAANRPFINTTCINKNDPIPQQKEKMPSECKVEGKTISGNTVSATIICPNMTATSTYTYAGTTFEGKTVTKMKIEGKEMVSNTTLKGKYLGPCPPEQQTPKPKPQAQANPQPDQPKPDQPDQPKPRLKQA